MTENTIPANELRKPEQGFATEGAAMRNAVIDAAIQNLAFATRLLLMNQPLQISQAPAQPAYEQPISQPVASGDSAATPNYYETQQPTGTQTSHHSYAQAAVADAYADPSHVEMTETIAPVASTDLGLTDEQLQRIESARQNAEDARSNYGLAT